MKCTTSNPQEAPIIQIKTINFCPSMQMTLLEQASELMQPHGKMMWLIVLDHQGSSPGKRGFQMFVSEDSMTGTIGGGIMEHKLVEYARSFLKNSSFKPVLKRQIHQPEASKDKSGMICSGEQIIGMYVLTHKDFCQLKEDVLQYKYLVFTHLSFYLQNNKPELNQCDFSTDHWYFSFPLQYKDKIYVIGAGHVGLAVCQLLTHLYVEIVLIDDRANLNTFHANHFAAQKIVTEYNEIGQYIDEGNHIYVVVCTFGFRTDKTVIKQIAGKSVAFLGVLGSQSKIKTLWQELENEGISKDVLDSIHAPIGVSKHCSSAIEIAFSIVMQIIMIKNQQSESVMN